MVIFVRYAWRTSNALLQSAYHSTPRIESQITVGSHCLLLNGNQMILKVCCYILSNIFKDIKFRRLTFWQRRRHRNRERRTKGRRSQLAVHIRRSHLQIPAAEALGR